MHLWLELLLDGHATHGSLYGKLREATPVYPNTKRALRVQSTQIWSICGFYIRNRNNDFGNVLCVLGIWTLWGGWLPRLPRGSKSRTSNSGLKYSYGVDSGTLMRWIYFLNPTSGLGEGHSFGEQVL